MINVLLDVLPWSLYGSDRAQRLYVVALGALVLGTLLCVFALRFARLDVPAVAVAGGGMAAWLLSSRPAEGRILLVLQPGNGITLSDLAAVPALLLVSVLTWRRVRGR